MNLRIRDLREDADLKQKVLAAYLHCDQSLYSKYERGERPLPLECADKLADFYHVSVDYLLAASLDGQPIEKEEKPNLPPHQRLVMKEILTTLKKQLDHWDYDAEEEQNK